MKRLYFGAVAGRILPSSDLSRDKEKTMKLTRVVLVCTLLLLASTPLFALPQCKECVNNRCLYTGSGIDVCRILNGVCETNPGPCSTFASENPVLADWTVASVEITRPAPETKTVAAPSAPAVVSTPEPAAKK
jgi:hypothetical protein